MAPSVTVWCSDTTSLIESGVAKFVRTALGSPDTYDSVSIASADTADAVCRLNEAFNKVVRVTMSDTTLHIIAVLPLWDSDFDRKITLLADACAAMEHKVSVHLLGLCPALRHLFDAKGPSSVDSAPTKASDCGLNIPFSFTLIDDYAANGAPMRFTPQSLSRYIATFQVALIQNYYGVLSPALLASHPGFNLSIGLATIGFDAEAAARQLLGMGFIAALDKVGVNNKEVDAQKAANTAESFLSGISARYPALFDKKIRPIYKEHGKDHGTAAADAAKILDTDLSDLRDAIYGLIRSGSLSFPEKEAVLAMILGRDNENVRGLQYDHESTLLDDVCAAPIDLYVKAFNEHCIDSGLLPVRGLYPLLKKFQVNVDTMTVEESPENKLAMNPLPDIKRLKQSILNTAAFIREKNDEVSDLQKSESHRRDVAEIKKRWHRPAALAPAAEYKEQPLNDKYAPSPALQIKDAVDLRRFFSPVRDQRGLGSCTSFAVASMYEAIMNMAGTSADADMSPAYLYFHSNVANGRPAGGSNFYEQLQVLGSHGICMESLYRYDADNPTTPPSAAAEDDAASHRALKARQIMLADEPDKSQSMARNHRMLTAALSEGHPVGISLKVYDNFGCDGPFVRHPEDSAEAKEDGWHAMVLAGYSQEGSFYIVRNSWGPDFGEEGYCYVPMAYIEDPDYMNFACVITETTDSAAAGPAEIPAVVADFEATETEIRMAAIRNVISKAKIELKSGRRLYSEYYKYYQRLVQQLTMPAVQTKIREAAESSKTADLYAAQTEKNALESAFVSRLKNHRKSLRHTIFVLLLTSLILWVAYYFSRGKILLCSSAIATTLGVFAWLGYKWNVRIFRRALQDEVDAQAIATTRHANELNEMQIRFHVAGMWISRFHKLSNELGNTYERLVSYNSTLREWYRGYTAEVSAAPLTCGDMFRYLDATPFMPSFFNANKEEILSKIDLVKVFESYQANESSLEESSERLQQAVTGATSELLSGFNMIDYLLGQTYPYLPPADIQGEVANLMAVGQPSCRNTEMNATPSTYIVMSAVDHRQSPRWDAVISQLFPQKPIALGYNSTTSLVLITLHPIPA